MTNECSALKALVVGRQCRRGCSPGSGGRWRAARRCARGRSCTGASSSAASPSSSTRACSWLTRRSRTPRQALSCVSLSTVALWTTKTPRNMLASAGVDGQASKSAARRAPGPRHQPAILLTLNVSHVCTHVCMMCLPAQVNEEKEARTGAAARLALAGGS